VERSSPAAKDDRGLDLHRLVDRILTTGWVRRFRYGDNGTTPLRTESTDQQNIQFSATQARATITTTVRLTWTVTHSHEVQ
jgi:hypothetical protein